MINQIRGFLLERGIIVRQGLRFLRQALPDILAKRTDVLSPRMVRIIADLTSDWRQLDERIEPVTDEIETLAKNDSSCRRVITVPAVVGRMRALMQNASTRTDRVDINEAVREVIELTRGEALKNGVSVKTKLAEGLPIITGDRVQLQQVVLNLILNALQAMEAVNEGARQALITTSQTELNDLYIGVQDTEAYVTLTSDRENVVQCVSVVDQRILRCEQAHVGIGLLHHTKNRLWGVHADSPRLDNALFAHLRECWEGPLQCDREFLRPGPG